MKEMYWIDVLGNISTAASVFACLSILSALICLIAIASAISEDSKDDVVFGKKWAKRLGLFGILFTLIAVFTPSTNSMYIIYGVGGVIDYIKNNDTAKQLPDKVINALDRWVDSQTESDNDKRND